MTAPPSRLELSGLVEAREHVFTDPDLRVADVARDGFGAPDGISGANAVVFDVRGRTQRWAVKCFTTESPDRWERYAAVAEVLSAEPHRWAIDFDFQPAGIDDGRRALPIVKMPWVDGVDLLEWLREHLGDRRRTAAMAARFADVVADLHAAGMAHGDLQHGNILVRANDDIVLVDYDGMYVPALARRGAAERGHPAYQSPRRGTAWSPAIDRYSAWLIYASLLVLAIDPTLFVAIPAAGRDRLLLGPEDHDDLRASPALAILRRHRDERVREVAETLAELADLAVDDIRPLTPPELPALDGVGVTEEPNALIAVLDDPAVAEVDPQADDVPEVGWSTSVAGIRSAALVAAVFAGLALAAVGWVAGLGVLGVLALTLYCVFRLGPERRSAASARARAAATRAERRRRESVHGVARDRHARAVRAGREAVDAIEARRREIIERRAQSDERTTADVEGSLAAIWERRRAMEADWAAERRDDLRRVAATAVTHALQAVPLVPGAVDGIEVGLVERLRDVGITTAADITWSTELPTRPQRVSGRGVGRGRTVELTPTQMRSLARWRLDHDPSVRGTTTEEVTAAEGWDRRIVAALLELSAEEDAIRTAAALSLATAAEADRRTLDELAAAEQATHEEAERAIAEAAVEVRMAGAALVEARRLDAVARRDVDAHRGITFPRWLLHVVAGR